MSNDLVHSSCDTNRFIPNFILYGGRVPTVHWIMKAVSKFPLSTHFLAEFLSRGAHISTERIHYMCSNHQCLIPDTWQPTLQFQFYVTCVHWYSHRSLRTCSYKWFNFISRFGSWIWYQTAQAFSRLTILRMQHDMKGADTGCEGPSKNSLSVWSGYCGCNSSSRISLR